MVFSSFEFLVYFLPGFLLVYYLAPARWKNSCLFAGSLIFYAVGVRNHPFYLALIVCSVLVNYRVGRAIGLAGRKSIRKRWLAAGLVYNFGWLVFFKYLDFILENVNRAGAWMGASRQIPYLNLVLPIGISFYTFQISSYLIDVYRGKVRAERSVIALGTYLCMFPQLIAGPIVTYSSVNVQLRARKHSMAKVEEGLKLFTLGLGYKVLIANQVAGLWHQVNTIGYDSISTPLAWMGIAAYSFQIYFDFYGYSLMAKGLGKLLGFQFPDNFSNPYLSLSMTEFWRRWHITLGSWFREYVYIPLGGNRKGFARTIRNMLAVWLLTGLWHGASWNFILWGFMMFVLISVEKMGWGKVTERFRLLGHLYMALVIPLTWLIFAVPDMGQIGLYLSRLFPFLGGVEGNVFAGDYVKYGKMYGISMIAALIFSTGLPERMYRKWKFHVVTALLLTAVFWGAVYCIYLGMDDPFLYFNF
ncbi:MBOAT family O-acyltransferase [Hungatella hathewayi]|uniref:MBOAT family protein n=1 Tax=Hungatella hathewayi WAL-18680 TaxID=742737 RepID=G5IEG8_9FIRM|nr:MBOAT family O-acyltransferase [Hungatella hathewayi]EHI60117.1 hypothetical protein HMPREF9473_01895 [ [Hungatella hathewayi WAL-18680]MBS4986650.1 MBOAT family protein [Hungatella hathewayi]